MFRKIIRKIWCFFQWTNEKTISENQTLNQTTTTTTKPINLPCLSRETYFFLKIITHCTNRHINSLLLRRWWSYWNEEIERKISVIYSWNYSFFLNERISRKILEYFFFCFLKFFDDSTSPWWWWGTFTFFAFLVENLILNKDFFPFIFIHCP